jgi:hypothetical protein
VTTLADLQQSVLQPIGNTGAYGAPEQILTDNGKV